ncbi:MAG: hypothetical protein HYX24_00035 [Candidatus Aenigmarchaeota archaeon]|nr:hypothetical protein [Candidatus Aenigmarchaeota archaeon]
MKFKKILLIGIDGPKLDAEYWKRIDILAEKKVSLPKDSSEIIDNLKDTDCLLVNFGIEVGRHLIDNAPELKYIGIMATAFGKIDAAYAKDMGITVCNVPGYSTESVAEFVFAALLEHIRELERGKRQAKEGNFSEAGFRAMEIKNKTFGILGLGRIGTRVAEIAVGFGADVRYWSRERRRELEARGIKYENLDNLISECDILSIHLAQTKETENFLNEEMLRRIKKDSIVINTAPMELIDIGALEKRLGRNDLTFILDHSDEMKQADLEKLSKHKNCMIYPPIACISKEARAAKQEIFAGNLENFLNGRKTNCV